MGYHRPAMRSVYGGRTLGVLVCMISALGCSDPAPTLQDAARDAATSTATDSGVVDGGLREPPSAFDGPDDACPGADHCRGEGDGRLYAGFAREDINPTIVEREWTDTSRDNAWQEGEPFVDRNGNGVFDATWIAGFGVGRPAVGSNDDLDVRAMALRYNDTLVAVAAIDCVGFFIDEIDRVLRDPQLDGLGLDKVLISATHNHEGVDTIGLWGRGLLQSGLNAEYQARVRTQTARAIRRAVMALRPARMRVAQRLTVDPMTGDTRAYVNDVRDPVLYDPTVTVVQFVDDASPTQTLGSWVNWSSHPEYAGSRNNLLSADYIHWLRETLEQGVPEDSLPGIGGVTVFVNGALGGQIGPGGVRPRGDDGMPITEAGLPKARAAGRAVGRIALEAITRDGVEASDTAITYRTAPLWARAENTTYALGYTNRVFDRTLHYWDPTRTVRPGNQPWVRSRVTYLQVGPVATITAPGELHPELWVGYDPRFSWGQPTLTETVNRVDLSQAPPPPYLRDVMLQNPGVRYAFVSGLTEDFLGYIVARINYVLNPALPYLLEADGDHYEETNSLGPDVERFLHGPMVALARGTRPMP